MPSILDRFTLDGKVAVVTGASSGLGVAFATGLTRDLAQQWTGRYGIRVNVLARGFFRSEMTDQYPDDYIEGRLERVPGGRVEEPEELVVAALFLASDAASYVTGIVLPVDGGTLTS